jgi:hypothetical protein
MQHARDRWHFPVAPAYAYMLASEVTTVHDMAIAMEYRHLPIRALALYAQRIGRVFAAPATWARLIRERGWRRPR